MNIPGVISIEFFAITESLSALIKKGDSFSLSELTSDSLTNIEFIQDSCGFKIDVKKTQDGNLYNYRVSFKIAGHNENTIAILNSLSQSESLFVVSDKSGSKYILGTIDNSFADVSFELKNDASPKGGRSISVVLKGSASIFPLYLQ